MSINLYRVIQPVHDIEVAQRFYSYVFDDAGERVSPGRHYFHCGNTILACYDPDADGDGSDHTWMPHGNQYLYFAVSNLDAVLNRVREAGGIILSQIETMPWGERLFYCKDPFANPIAFVDQTTVFNGKATGSMI